MTKVLERYNVKKSKLFTVVLKGKYTAWVGPRATKWLGWHIHATAQSLGTCALENLGASSTQIDAMPHAYHFQFLLVISMLKESVLGMIYSVF